MTKFFSKYITIGDIADVKGGKRLPKGMAVQDERTDHPYLRVVDFSDDGLNRSNIKYIDEIAHSKVKRYTISSKDVYISIAGTIGRVGIIPADLSGANLTENAAKITNISKSFSKTFLMYFLRSHRGQSDIKSKVVGTSQPKLALFRIEELKIPCVPLLIQCKIAAILSAYDDLIENNLRRIKILEEMAQNLYREWFVNFRFPGHKKVKMVDSPLGKIPEGWEVAPVTEAIDVNPRVTVPKDGNKSFVPMGSLSNDSMLISNIESRSGNSGSKFKNMDTLFARITPCLENGKTGYVQFLRNDDETAFGSTEFIVFRTRKLCSEYVYLMARSSAFREHAIKSMSGATGRQRVSDKCFKQFLIAQPDLSMLKIFKAIVSPIFAYIFILSAKNTTLRQTRDLLLPKLISGEVDVSELDITIPGEAEA